MSKVADLLRQKRMAQIAEMEGRESETNVDSEIRELQKELSNKGYRGKKRKKRKRRGSLYISKHARLRMAHRRMEYKHVYTIWTFGEVKALRDGRHAHVCTSAALEEMPKHARELLSRFAGAAIIVEPNIDAALRPTLVTVLADGEDTRFC